MHVLRVVRVLLPVLILAAVVGAGSSVLSARPDLQNAKRNVDTAWTSLAGQLEHRYLLLAAVDDKLRPVPGPIHAIVADADAALAHWHDVRANSGVAAQVQAANDIEALARELVAASAASPRVQDDRTALPALATFLSDTSRNAATGFNHDVTSYEHERHGPVRTVLASVFGDASIPVLDTTATTSSETA